MQPYQEASQEMRRQGELPIRAIKTVGSVGAGAALGGGLIVSKILPFLNRHIPTDLFLKGISKVDPRFGKFVTSALDSGSSVDEIKDFIRSKAMGEESPEVAEQSTEPEKKNIIAQYSDKLHQFLQNLIREGKSPVEAGAIASVQPEFKEVIKKMSKDHKATWNDILINTFGPGEKAQAQPQQEQTQQLQPQQGNSDQALLAAMQKILQM
jgi:hypothetical protein